MTFSLCCFGKLRGSIELDETSGGVMTLQDWIQDGIEALQEERQKGVDLAFAKWSDHSKRRL
jgi:hypothetical protein